METKIYSGIMALLFVLIVGCKSDDDAAPTTPQIPTNGLVAYYPLDGDGADFSGNNFDGATNNITMASNRNGEADKAMEFNGVDSNVSLGDVLDQQTTGNSAFSMSFWIYSSGNADNNLLVSKLADTGCGEDQRQFTVRLVDNKFNGLFFYSLAGQNFRRWATETTISASTWYHIVFNYDPSVSSNDGAGRFQVYINGLEESVTLDGSTGTLGEIQDGTAHLGIGNRLDSNGDN